MKTKKTDLFITSRRFNVQGEFFNFEFTSDEKNQEVKVYVKNFEELKKDFNESFFRLNAPKKPIFEFLSRIYSTLDGRFFIGEIDFSNDIEEINQETYSWCLYVIGSCLYGEPITNVKIRHDTPEKVLNEFGIFEL